MTIKFWLSDPADIVKNLHEDKWNIPIGLTRTHTIAGKFSIGLCRNKPYEFTWIANGINSIEFAELLEQCDISADL
jgi:hypothetical protein